MTSVLIDSDVLVWLTRGHVGAAKRLHALPGWRSSAVDGLAIEAFLP